MGTLRALARLVALVLSTSLHYARLQAGTLAARLKGEDPAGRRSAAAGRWARSVGRIMGMRVRTQGDPPAAPFLLVANHLSYVDVLLLLGHCPDATFIAKREVQSWPLVGFLARSVGTLFINRENRRDLLRVNALVAEALDAGGGVVLFAEGTTSKGARIRPLKPSLLAVAAERALPVAHSTIAYRTDADATPAHLSVCWWDDSPFALHAFRLLKMPRFEAELRFGGRPVTETDRKALAAGLHAALSAGFTPSAPDDAPEEMPDEAP